MFDVERELALQKSYMLFLFSSSLSFGCVEGRWQKRDIESLAVEWALWSVLKKYRLPYTPIFSSAVSYKNIIALGLHVKTFLYS